jgi:hypothetical protein
MSWCGNRRSDSRGKKEAGGRGDLDARISLCLVVKRSICKTRDLLEISARVQGAENQGLGLPRRATSAHEYEKRLGVGRPNNLQVTWQVHNNDTSLIIGTEFEPDIVWAVGIHPNDELLLVLIG